MICQPTDVELETIISRIKNEDINLQPNFQRGLGLLLLLAKSTGLFGACMIMAGIFAVLLIAALLLRKQLVIDPIARFLSQLFLK